MPVFRLNDCSLSLSIEPLVGELASADRQLAWCVYLALVTRPGLRDEQMQERELRVLIEALQARLEDWPAPRIDTPRAGQLGFVLVTVIEMILLPCLSRGIETSAGWHALQDFCEAFAREIADTYGFPIAGRVPNDLLDAWQAR